MKRFLAIFILCMIYSCSDNSNQGYDDLEELYQDFPKMLKSDNWSDLENYVEKIVPGQPTFDYMEMNKFSYRGVPESTIDKPLTAEYVKLFYLNSVANFRLKLEKKNQLKDLIYIGREREGTEMYHEELGIEVTETFIILQSGKEKFRCKLGEMFKINNQWKSFTDPKLGW